MFIGEQSYRRIRGHIFLIMASHKKIMLIRILIFFTLKILILTLLQVNIFHKLKLIQEEVYTVGSKMHIYINRCYFNKS